MHIFILLLLLTSFVSNAEDLAFVQGDLRVYLPRNSVANGATLELVEQTNLQNTHVISTQYCSLKASQVCNIALPYSAININQLNTYAVKVSMAYQIDTLSKKYQSLFPVLSFTSGQKLNIVISLPALPIE